MADSPIIRRKGEHLRIVLEQDVQHPGSTLLECVQLMHRALPELDLDAVDLGVEFFGKRLAAPLMITGMTGGAQHAGELNRGLAQAAAQAGIAFSTGSQRLLFHHPEALPDFAVRECIPNGVLLGNLGAAQLRDYPPQAVAELAQRIDADGMCLHLNPAQELAQPAGDRGFAGILAAIARLVELLPGRVLVKETGAGLSPQVVRELYQAGVRHFDVAGAGGTSWTKVEGLRQDDGTPAGRQARQLGLALAGWGLPTAYCIIGARNAAGPVACIVGSGGIAGGLDAARAIACGADIAGFARAALLEFHRGGGQGALGWIEGVKSELRAVMLLCGVANVLALKSTSRVYTGALRSWISAGLLLDEERE
jgi:isopentenyl-diphosphate Delta-isomerase